MTGPFTIDRDVDGATLTVPVTPTAGIERFIAQVKTHDGLRATLLYLITRPDGDVHQVQAEKNLRRFLTETLTEPLDETAVNRFIDEVNAAAAVEYCDRCDNYAIDRHRCGIHLEDYRPIGGAA